MKNWKLYFLEKALLGRDCDLEDRNDVLDRCIRLAYQDMLSAGRYYANAFVNDKNTICASVKTLIQKENFHFSRDIITQCALLFSNSKTISLNSNFVTTFGLAQKLINMSFKYIYIFKDHLFDETTNIDFSQCDCPLDSIILTNINAAHHAWSKLTPDDYLKYQNRIAQQLTKIELDSELLPLGRLAYDFLYW